MSKKLKIKLLPNGEIIMETEGVKGKQCLEYVKKVAEMANGKITDTQLTDEYYETEERIQVNNQQNINEY